MSRDNCAALGDPIFVEGGQGVSELHDSSYRSWGVRLSARQRNGVLRGRNFGDAKESRSGQKTTIMARKRDSFPLRVSVGSGPKGTVTAAHARRKSAGSIPACLSIARSVPSGMSPGWFGTVVYRSVRGLNQISWLPAAWRSNSKPHTLSFRAISRYRNPASRPIQAATTIV